MTKAIKKLSEKITRRNRDFAKKTKAEQRVAVAKDVILGLNAKKFKAKSGVYVENNALEKLVNKNPDVQLCTLIDKVPSCNLCAKGALFLATVSRKNALSAGDVTYDAPYYGETKISDEETISNYLNKDDLFSRSQLDLIESQFEQEEICGKYTDHFRVWKPELQSADKRMRAIMTNIISNKGIFKPLAKDMKSESQLDEESRLFND